jgi:hypothetical protein
MLKYKSIIYASENLGTSYMVSNPWNGISSENR